MTYGETNDCGVQYRLMRAPLAECFLNAVYNLVVCHVGHYVLVLDHVLHHPIEPVVGAGKPDRRQGGNQISVEPAEAKQALLALNHRLAVSLKLSRFL